MDYSFSNFGNFDKLYGSIGRNSDREMVLGNSKFCGPCLLYKVHYRLSLIDYAGEFV